MNTPALSWESLDALVAISDPARRAKAVAELLANPAFQHYIARVARTLAHRYNVIWDNDGPDLVSELMTAAYTTVADGPSGASWLKIRRYMNFQTGFYYVAVAVAKRFVESAQYLGSSGLSGRTRRARALAVHRQRLEALRGGPVTDRELVASFNAAQSRGRSGATAVKRGMVASVNDIGSPRPVEVSPGDELPGPDVDECELLPLEATRLISYVIEAAQTRPDPVPAVTRAWLGQAMGEPPFIANIAEICSITGLARGPVRLALLVAQDVAREVLEERFGIVRDTTGMESAG